MSEIPGDTFVCCLERGKHAETCVHHARREDAAGERVAQIAARLNAATSGPWAWANTCEKGYGANVGAGCFGEDDPNCTQPLSGDLTDSGEYYVDQPIAQLDHQKAAADAQFIAHAREDIPWLLAALSAAERERDELRDALLATKPYLYHRHSPLCESYRSGANEAPCSCGLDEILARLAAL